MLILASNNDRIQLVTGSAGAIDVHASWMDNVGGSVVPGRTNTGNINIAATTTVVPQPAVNVFRSVKTLYVRNRGTVDNVITVIHTDGTTAVELHRTTLPPNVTLQYIDELGWALGGIADVSSQPPGSLILIEHRAIPPAPGVSTVEFKTGINDTYDLFVFRIYSVRFPNPDWLYLRVSTDGGNIWRAEPNSYQFMQNFASVSRTTPLIGYSTDNKMQVGPQAASESQRLGMMINIQFARPWEPTERHLFMGSTAIIHEAEGMTRSDWVGEYFGNPFVTQAWNAVQFKAYTDGPIIGGVFTLFGIKK